MEEPSVLDYVKSRLMPWKYPRLSIPDELETASLQVIETRQDVPAPANVAINNLTPSAITTEKSKGEAAEQLRIVLPWRSLAALALALAAQWSLAPCPERSAQPGITLLLAAGGFLFWAYWRGEWQLAPIPVVQVTQERAALNLMPFLASLATTLITYLSFGSLEFNFINLALLLITVGLGMLAFYPRKDHTQTCEGITNYRSAMRRMTAGLLPSWRWLGIAAGIALVVFFRYSRLHSVPPEMNSDHAEKILDVLRVLNGQAGIFFPSNGGREALQFYLVAGLNKYLHLPLGFDILKLVTITVGFLTLPFIYLIGKEIANRRVGWLAFLFAGIAYWPNVVSRIGFRLPFYMLFTATTMYFLLRGIRRGRQLDFILAGISLGVSFYGYSADRILPLLVIVGVGLFLLSPEASERRQRSVTATLSLAFIAFIIFLPLLRYMQEEPQDFLYRTLTRMGNLEKPLAGPAWLVFSHNLLNAAKMFSWSAGAVWPISIPDYPALGMISGGLFYLGLFLVLIRVLQRRNWFDTFLLLSIPILMLPSLLSLAFPDENPNLYRTGGAIVPVFLLVGLALDGLMRAIENINSYPTSRRLAWGLAVVLLGMSMTQEYDLVFSRYYEQYQLSAWNSSEMGQAARDFIGLTNSPDSVFVVGYPYWVDTRLVALNAGFPGRDYQIFTEQLDSTLRDSQAKLFIVNLEDNTAQQKLRQLYPAGWFQQFISRVEGKDFLLFLVPPTGEQSP